MKKISTLLISLISLSSTAFVAGKSFATPPLKATEQDSQVCTIVPTADHLYYDYFQNKSNIIDMRAFNIHQVGATIKQIDDMKVQTPLTEFGKQIIQTWTNGAAVNKKTLQRTPQYAAQMAEFKQDCGNYYIIQNLITLPLGL